MNNPLQMNDWEIKKFLKAIFALQLAMWGCVGLDAMGLYIPIIRQLVAFVYLTFVPGIIILRILKLHKLSNIETILYTVGLSIATLMFTGFLINMVYPVFGISGPISILPLMITISVVVFASCILCYLRDKDFSNPSFIEIKNVLSPPILFLCLIPLLSIFGTYFVNFYHSNILLMFLIIIIAIIVILIVFDKFIPKNLYPLAIFAIALALLYHWSLISQYLIGWDIQHEYYLANLVVTNLRWDPSIPYMTNGMLSITMLAPIFSAITDIGLIWVFKIAYPLLFSLVPLGLYRVFQKQTDEKIAFLSVFFFMSIFTFYTEILALARQQIAELFLVLLILLTINKDFNKTKRSLMFVVFAFSLVVSHYGLSYIYMFCLISAWLILIFMEKSTIARLKDVFFSRFIKEKFVDNTFLPKTKNRTITLPLVLIFTVLALTWYMYISSSSSFNSIVFIGSHITNTIFIEFLNPQAVQGMGIAVSKTVSPIHEMAKYIHLTTLFFILIGVLTLFLKHDGKIKFRKEYIAFSYISLIICFAGISVPHFSSVLNTTRLYHIISIILAPFCVIGGVAFLRVISRPFRSSWADKSIKTSFKILSLFLSIFLLFNTGFIYEVLQDSPTSISLDSTNKVDFPKFNDMEVLGAKWLNDMKVNKFVYADRYRMLLLGSFEWEDARVTPVNISKIPRDSYIYLGTLNVMKEIMVDYTNKYTNSENITNSGNKIYASGGTSVYYR